MSKWRLKTPKWGLDALLQLASADARDTPHGRGPACPQLARVPLNCRRPSNSPKATGSNPKPEHEAKPRGRGDSGAAHRALRDTQRSFPFSKPSKRPYPCQHSLDPQPPSKEQALAPTQIPLGWEAAEEMPPTPSHGRTSPGTNKTREKSERNGVYTRHEANRSPSQPEQPAKSPSLSHQDPNP